MTTFSFCVTGLFAVLSASVLAAESPADGALEEIVVTAQKREQNVQDVGISISVLGGQQLAQLGVTDTQGLENAVPGLRMESPGGPASTTFTIRGVGQRDIADHNEAAVLVYNDGVYVSWIGAAGAPLFDLERVEVLKGPQGTLFGRNATGGLISIVNAKPKFETEGYLKGTAGSYGQYGFEGALNLPLNDIFSTRVSFSTNHENGYYDNTAGPDLQQQRSYNLRGQLRFRPNDRVNVNLEIRTTRFDPALSQGVTSHPLILDSAGIIRPPADRNEFVAYCNATFPAAPLFGLTLAPPGSETHGNCFSNVGADPYRGAWLQPKYYNHYNDFSATADVNLTDSISATAISSYQTISKGYQADDSGGIAAPELFFFDNRSTGRQFTQELRLQGSADRYHWVAGGYYFWRKDNVYSALDFLNNPALGVQLGSQYISHSKSIAGFLQGDYNLTDQLVATLGGRYGSDRKEMDNNPFCNANPAFTGAVVPGFDQCQLFGTFVFPSSLQFNGHYANAFTHNDYSAKAELDYHFNHEAMIYASFNRGIKAGGFNAGAAQFYPLSQVIYKPETLYAYEVGLKAQPGWGITVDGAAFYYDYRNYQTFVLLGGAFETLNVNATVKGAELDVTARPIRGLMLRAAATYLDGIQKNVPYLQSFADFVMPSAPRWMASGTARYGFPLGSLGELAFEGDLSYTTSRSTNAIDYPGVRLNPYALLNLRTTFTTPDDRWSASVFVNNATDKAYTIIRSDVETLTGGTTDTYGRPRWFGGTIEYRF